jgi:hypothetical protein
MKAVAESDGDDSLAKSLYLGYRAQSLVDDAALSGSPRDARKAAAPTPADDDVPEEPPEAARRETAPTERGRLLARRQSEVTRPSLDGGRIALTSCPAPRP